MKKFTHFSFLIVLAFNANFVSAQLNRVALISVYADRNLSDNPLEKAMNEKIMKDSSFNLAPFVENFSKVLNEELIKEFPFPFVPKDEVINAPGYKELSKLTGFVDGKTNELGKGQVPMYEVAKGYIPIASFGIIDDTKAIKKSFDNLPSDVDGVMIAYLTYKLVDQVGAFNITIKKVQAYVNIKIFNKEGKRIFKLKDSEDSKGGITALGGFVVEVDKIMPHIKSASDNLIVSIKKKMIKSLAKLAKKIEKNKED